MVLRRIKKGNGYKYYNDTTEIKNNKHIEEIATKFKQLRIPPGYINVELFPNSKEVIAKCKDADNRSQYLYHPEFVKKQKKLKYCNLIKFGKQLPTLQRKIEKDFKSTDAKKKAIATALKVVLECNFRIGNKKYKDKYNSHGVLTMDASHIKGNKIEFTGKKGVDNKCTITDRQLLTALNKLKKNKDFIFQYDGKILTSKVVNNYLDNVGKGFTAKYFRTWAANINFIEEVNGKTLTTKSLKEAIEQVAIKLDHTAAICKKSYLYDELMDYALEKGISTRNPDKYLIDFLQKKC